MWTCTVVSKQVQKLCFEYIIEILHASYIQDMQQILFLLHKLPSMFLSHFLAPCTCRYAKIYGMFVAGLKQGEGCMNLMMHGVPS